MSGQPKEKRQKFSGSIVEIDEERFYAILEDFSDENSLKYEFSYELKRVKKGKKRFITKGQIFHLYVYENDFKLIFKNPGPWTEEELKKARERAEGWDKNIKPE